MSPDLQIQPVIENAGSSRCNRQAEDEAIPWAEWLTRQGRAIGARLPTTEERSRALELEGYYHALEQAGLTSRQIFDVQRNAFDRDAFRTRVHASLVLWLSDQTPPIPPQPTLVDAAYCYQAL